MKEELFKRKLIESGWDLFNSKYFKTFNGYEFVISFYSNKALVVVYDIDSDEEDNISFFIDSLERLELAIYGITGVGC